MEQQLDAPAGYQATIVSSDKLRQDKKKGSGDQRGKAVRDELSFSPGLEPPDSHPDLLHRTQYTAYSIICKAGQDQWTIQKRFEDVRSLPLFPSPVRLRTPSWLASVCRGGSGSQKRRRSPG